MGLSSTEKRESVFAEWGRLFRWSTTFKPTFFAALEMDEGVRPQGRGSQEFLTDD